MPMNYGFFSDQKEEERTIMTDNYPKIDVKKKLEENYKKNKHTCTKFQTKAIFIMISRLKKKGLQKCLSISYSTHLNIPHGD